MSPGLTSALALACALAVLAIAAVTDLRDRVVPNALTLTAFVVGTILSALSGSLAAHATAAVCTVAVLLGVRALGHAMSGRPGLGLGDVKLGAGLALLLGWTALWSFYLAAVVGSLLGAVAWLRGHRTLGRPVPFVPAILAGVVLAATVLPFGRVWNWVSP